MTDTTQQRANRIAMWRAEILDPDRDEALTPLAPLLASFEADVAAQARAGAERREEDSGMRARVQAALNFKDPAHGVSCDGPDIYGTGCFAGGLARRVREAIGGNPGDDPVNHTVAQAFLLGNEVVAPYPDGCFREHEPGMICILRDRHWEEEFGEPPPVLLCMAGCGRPRAEGDHLCTQCRYSL